MQHNILRDSSVTKIYLMYTHEGSKKKITVKLKFMDHKICYFASPAPAGFSKPKKKIPAEIHVYTADGVYRTTVTLLDSTMSLNEIMYEASIPKDWNYVQMRDSTRKIVSLPVDIKFNDGFEINAMSHDLSLGGVAFFTKEDIPGIYKKLSGILTLELPKEEIINFPDGKMVVETKFVREKSGVEDRYDEQFFSFRFIGLSQDGEMILKNFLMKLD